MSDCRAVVRRAVPFGVNEIEILKLGIEERLVQDESFELRPTVGFQQRVHQSGGFAHGDRSPIFTAGGSTKQGGDDKYSGRNSKHSLFRLFECEHVLGVRNVIALREQVETVA